MNEQEATQIVEKAAELAKDRFILFTASRDYLRNKGHSPDQELLTKIILKISSSKLSELQGCSGNTSAFARQLQRLIAEVLEEYSRTTRKHLDPHPFLP